MSNKKKYFESERLKSKTESEKTQEFSHERPLTKFSVVDRDLLKTFSA